MAEETRAEAARAALEDRFLASWSGVSALWGVSPTFGRIHALLLLSPKPLDAEVIGKRLGVSHGSCSTGLNTLIDWGVVRRVHPPGKRRTCYAPERDPWTWLRTCVRERRRREIAPLLDALREAREFAEGRCTEERERRTPGHRELADVRDRVRAFTGVMDEFAGLVDDFLEKGGPRRRRRRG
jgi:DNA-binding transcriptional regulator GbsR (MarR family)